MMKVHAILACRGLCQQILSGSLRSVKRIPFRTIGEGFVENRFSAISRTSSLTRAASAHVGKVDTWNVGPLASPVCALPAMLSFPTFFSDDVA